MIVNIANRTSVDTGVDNYTYCHGFTKAVILGIYYNGQLNPQLAPLMGQLCLARNNNNTILPVYAAMMGAAAGTQIFDQTTVNAVQAPGLILFSTGPIHPVTGQNIQHSMIAVGPNVWQGANNLNSLGAADSGVCIYRDMDTRRHNHLVTGGWADDGQMCAFIDPQNAGIRYTMYYIPL